MPGIRETRGKIEATASACRSCADRGRVILREDHGLAGRPNGEGYSSASG
jgi:hypothetical protein